MADLRKLTILHSNDMHGDFLAESIDDKLVGGVSLLSGYINKVRGEEENAIYAIAGDMFRGSIIDSEFKGISTVDIMNLLGPDVVCLGNHELDYGVAHLLFLDRCTKFPIVNANLYIKATGTRLFNSHVILQVGGMNILVIGLLTEEIMAYAKSDMLLGTFVSVEDAAQEVGHIINSYKTVDIDFTILLTHIGYEEDQKLAALLDPEWGVDVIIGGHTHTFLEKPAKVNDILIVQAGTGTDAIGRFDITVDCDANCVHDFTWQMVPINDETCPKDEALVELIRSYKKKTDDKYGQILTRFDRELTHPRREQETELGDLFADITRNSLGVDLALVGSGSIRKPRLGPIVTLQDLMEIYPFGDKVYAVKLTGAQLKRFAAYMCRDEMLEGHAEFYQVSGNARIVYDFAGKTLKSFTLDGREVEDEKPYTVSMQKYHYENIASNFGIPEEEVPGYASPKVVATSDFDIVQEALVNSGHMTAREEGRIVIENRPN